MGRRLKRQDSEMSLVSVSLLSSSLCLIPSLLHTTRNTAKGEQWVMGREKKCPSLAFSLPISQCAPTLPRATHLRRATRYMKWYEDDWGGHHQLSQSTAFFAGSLHQC